jgi:hypothetical protein
MVEITDEEYKVLLEYKWLKKIDEYARDFWTIELGKIDISAIFLKEPPIRYSVQDVIEKDVSGYTNSIMFAYVKVNQGMDCEKVNAVIRHELIHSALGMKRLKNDDHCAIFKIICDLYNANFYGLMNELETKIYESSIDVFSEAIEILRANNYTNNATVNIGIMLDIIGNKDIQSMDDIFKLRKDIEFMLKVMKDLEKYKEDLKR